MKTWSPEKRGTVKTPPCRVIIYLVPCRNIYPLGGLGYFCGHDFSIKIKFYVYPIQCRVGFSITFPRSIDQEFFWNWKTNSTIVRVNKSNILLQCYHISVEDEINKLKKIIISVVWMVKIQNKSTATLKTNDILTETIVDQINITGTLFSICDSIYLWTVKLRMVILVCRMFIASPFFELVPLKCSKL